MIKYIYLFLSMFCIWSLCQGQQTVQNINIDNIEGFKIPDSLKDVSLKILKRKSYANKEVPMLSNLYANCYLKKSVDTKDSIKIAKAYLMLSNIVAKDSLKFRYINKSIVYTKELDNPIYPAFAYFKKGAIFFNKGSYKESLSNYFIALDLAQNNNPKLANDIKFNIGLLKSHIGKKEEALKIFKECYIAYEKNRKAKVDQYLFSLFAISDAYARLQKTDSATAINTYGVKQTILYGLKDFKNYFVMNEGVNSFFKKEYQKSIDSLQKVMPFLKDAEDHSNELFSRFYLGKSYVAANQIEKGLMQLKKVDSLLKQRPDFIPEIKETYTILIDHYKKKNDTEQLLYYHNRLAAYDSLMYANYQNISDRIVTNFDTPIRLQQKDEMILDLTKSNHNKLRWGIPLVAISIVICFVLIYRNFTLKRGYQKKFNALIEKSEKPEPLLKKVDNPAATSAILSDDIVHKIEKGLSEFISEKQYLSKNVSVNSLAKKMRSNSKYLSQYLNHYEKKKFTDYVNDLRIDYAVGELRGDKKFRQYTIKAISETVGFSNPVSFSQAFFKKTGIKPSYFIKKLENI